LHARRMCHKAPQAGCRSRPVARPLARHAAGRPGLGRADQGHRAGRLRALRPGADQAGTNPNPSPAGRPGRASGACLEQRAQLVVRDQPYPQPGGSPGGAARLEQRAQLVVGERAQVAHVQVGQVAAGQVQPLQRRRLGRLRRPQAAMLADTRLYYTQMLIRRAAHRLRGPCELSTAGGALGAAALTGPWDMTGRLWRTSP